MKKGLDKIPNLWYNKYVIKRWKLLKYKMKEVDTMSTSKVTVRSQFEAVKAVLLETGHADLATFIDGRIEQTVKKNTAPRKPTAKQVENDAFKADILAWMDADTLYSAGDILKGVPSIVASGMSVNRVSALMTQLADAGSVNKVVDKRKNFYSLA